MSPIDYQRVERCLAIAEEIAMGQPFVTVKGEEIRRDIRALLVKVTAERIRSQSRELHPWSALTAHPIDPPPV